MQKAVILVGHGGVPTDCPPEFVAEFKRLEAASKGKPSAPLAEADRKLRQWPRTPQTDPYKSGLEAIAASLRQALPGRLVLEAYNEFCAPSLEETLASAARRGVKDIVVITTMYTRGGIHSETEIPAAVDEFRREHPGVSVRYCWPFDLNAISSFLAREIARAERPISAKKK